VLLLSAKNVASQMLLKLKIMLFTIFCKQSVIICHFAKNFNVQRTLTKDNLFLVFVLINNFKIINKRLTQLSASKICSNNQFCVWNLNCYQKSLWHEKTGVHHWRFISQR